MVKTPLGNNIEWYNIISELWFELFWFYPEIDNSC